MKKGLVDYMERILTDRIKSKVYSILTTILGEDATGIYTNVAGIYNNDCDTFYSTLLIDNGHIVDYGSEIEETDNIAICHGASRIAFIPNNENFVIKMPITGVYDWEVTASRLPTETELEEGYDDLVTSSFWASDEDEEYYEGKGYEITEREFRCYAERSEFDLMDSENAIVDELKEICEIASADVIDEIFLSNEYVGTFNGIPVWIQRKISCTQDNAPYTKLTEGQRALVSKTSPSSHLSDYFILALINVYGVAITRDITSAISCCGISDLHDGNIGYLADDAPVIFDYAGYEEEEIWKNFG